MNWKRASLEFGKQLLGVGVAGLIFAFIQPFVHGELTFLKAVWALVWYILLSVMGVVLIALGGDDG